MTVFVDSETVFILRGNGIIIKVCLFVCLFLCLLAMSCREKNRQAVAVKPAEYNRNGCEMTQSDFGPISVNINIARQKSVKVVQALYRFGKGRSRSLL